MEYKVLKFGGASIKDAKRIKNVAAILNQFINEKQVIVISALGKTTNALEKVVDAYFVDRNEATKLFSEIRAYHYQIVEELFERGETIYDELNDTFVEIDWVLEDEPHDSYDYIYDQIVSIGELVSTKIVEAYLQKRGFKSQWMDVRDMIISDDTYREANVDWKETEEKILQKTHEAFKRADWLVTQGYIASTLDNQTTTLGREGSDFSASIFSYVLDASCMIIWKDVPGILTADPQLFDEVAKIDRLSYKEAVEMTYYGAKVIHPKTIKPLQNKAIPLYVRSFLDPEGEGTLISDQEVLRYPPVVVIESNQALLHISTRDFSFVAEMHLSHLFDQFTKHRIKVNMMRNTAISFSICTFQIEDRLTNLLKELENDYKVIMDKDLELITIRHFNEETVQELTNSKVVLFEERLGNTIQMVVKYVPLIKRKNG